jgi:deazaflavin-dependent oxidoreductase (nitroreductase family)
MSTSTSDFDHPVDPSEGWQAEHVARYVATNGDEGHIWNGVPTLLLTTCGRRTGVARRIALIYGRHGESYVVVASKGGAPTHPDWYLNLTANPRVRVQVAADVFDATARTATPEEKAQLWPQMVQLFPRYAEYQAATDREIPLVILTRA